MIPFSPDSSPIFKVYNSLKVTKIKMRCPAIICPVYISRWSRITAFLQSISSVFIFSFNFKFRMFR